MKRMGIEAIYLGGWATSAKGSTREDPGPDLASYPLSQVPDEAAGLVRALLTADKNQHFARAQMDEKKRQAAPEVDFRPFIIADADTGHGGDAHVRNLVRRFVEVGVPGYHIEDQKPGAKKCGHQSRQGPGRSGRAEQAAECGAPAARHHEGTGHHRRPDRCGGRDVPRQPQRRARPAVHPRRDEPRAAELPGGLPGDPARPCTTSAWRTSAATCCSPCRTGSCARPGPGSNGSGSCRWSSGAHGSLATPKSAIRWTACSMRIDTRYAEVWQAEAGLKTYGEAVADVLESRIDEGQQLRRVGRRMAAIREPCVAAPRSARRPSHSHPRRLGPGAAQDPGRLLPGPGRHRIRDRQVAVRPRRSPTCSGWRRRRRISRTLAGSRTRSTPFIPTRCSPTTCRHRSTGTPPG